MKTLVLAVAFVTLLAPGCGGGSSQTPAEQAQPSAGPTIPAGAAEVDVMERDPSSLKLATSTVAHGQVAFKVTNAGPGQHDLHVQAKGSSSDVGSTPLIPGGSTQLLVVMLAAGTYSVYCGVPGHRAAGMEATLTVT